MSLDQPPSSDQPDAMIGKIIAGKYEILQQIGSGGMGAVYKAKDLELERFVAIKAARGEFSSESKKEARILARLNHPNIIRIDEIFVAEGTSYLVMEFLDGKTVEQMLRERGPIPYEHAIHLFQQALAGIGYAHRAGVVHGDIKPRNLVVTRNDVLKVMDFGTARLGTEDDAMHRGMLVGTPAYIAPEQLRDPEPNVLTDIYALGVTLYEMVTNHLPFPGDSVAAILSDLRANQPQRPTDFCPSLPLGLERIILKALSKGPRDRFQSAEEFSEAIEQQKRGGDRDVVPSVGSSQAPSGSIRTLDQVWPQAALRIPAPRTPPDDPRRTTAVGIPVPNRAVPGKQPADAPPSLGDTAAFALDNIRESLKSEGPSPASSAHPHVLSEVSSATYGESSSVAAASYGAGIAPAAQVLERTLDLAIAPSAPVQTPLELIALLRRPASTSLAQLLELDRDTDLKEKDVRTRNFGLEFEADEAGRLKPVDVTMRVIAPDFDPPQLEKVVRVRAQEDCERQTFLLTPKRTGELKVQFDVLLGKLTLASRALKTQAEPGDRLHEAAHPVVVSVPLSVKVGRRRPWRLLAVAAVLLIGVSAGGFWLWSNRHPAEDISQRGVTLNENPAAPDAAMTAIDSSRKQYALLIGIDAYQHLPRLQTAVGDAKSIAAILHDRYGFETRVLTDASRSEIVRALNDYRREMDENADLLIYYAGHGSYDKSADKAYWLPADADLADTTNWILADEITTDVKVIPAHHILVISDSCYSGGIARDVTPEFDPQERDRYLLKMFQGKSRTLMASGGLEPVSDKGSGGHSVFAGALIKGLFETQDPVFSAENLFDRYIRVPVAGQSEQSPQYSAIRNSGHEAGDFVFIRRDAAGQSGAGGAGASSSPGNVKPD